MLHPCTSRAPVILFSAPAVRAWDRCLRVLALVLCVTLLGSPEASGQETSTPSLARGEAPWSVARSPEVRQREVVFESDGIELAGTLHFPEGAEAGPAVVVVQQGGTQTRETPLYRQTAELLVQLGYSVLLYDRRGFGASGGAPEDRTYPVLAADAAAGMRAIGELEEVDAERIGLWGISQGGWLAMMAGVEADAAFVIAVSTPLVSPDEQMETLAYNYVLLAGYGEEAARRAREARRAVSGEFYRGERSRESAQEVLEAIRDEPWYDLTYLPLPEALPEEPSSSTWYDEMRHDPTVAFEALDAPLLFLLGGEDADIPVARTLAVADSLGERPNRDVVVIPGATHLMRIEEDPADHLELGPSATPNAPAYFLVMGEWLGRLE